MDGMFQPVPGPIMGLTSEVLSVFASVVGLLPGIGVGSCLNLADESGAVGSHLAVGIWVIVVEKEYIFGGDLLSHLVVH